MTTNTDDPRLSALLREGAALVLGQTHHQRYSDENGESLHLEDVDIRLTHGLPLRACAEGCVILALARRLGRPLVDLDVGAAYCQAVPAPVTGLLVSWNDDMRFSLEEIAQRLERQGY